MQLITTEQFIRDLSKISKKSVIKKISDLVKEIEQIPEFKSFLIKYRIYIRQLDATDERIFYRYKINKDYRLGFSVENTEQPREISFDTILPRGKIYNYYPPKN